MSSLSTFAITYLALQVLQCHTTMISAPQTSIVQTRPRMALLKIKAAWWYGRWYIFEMCHISYYSFSIVSFPCGCHRPMNTKLLEWLNASMVKAITRDAPPSMPSEASLILNAQRNAGNTTNKDMPFTKFLMTR